MGIQILLSVASATIPHSFRIQACYLVWAKRKELGHKKNYYDLISIDIVEAELINPMNLAFEGIDKQVLEGPQYQRGKSFYYFFW